MTKRTQFKDSHKSLVDTKIRTYKSLHAEEFVPDNKFCRLVDNISISWVIQVVIAKPDNHLPCSCICQTVIIMIGQLDVQLATKIFFSVFECLLIPKIFFHVSANK